MYEYIQNQFYIKPVFADQDLDLRILRNYPLTFLEN
jgi:hypothetical protein